MKKCIDKAAIENILHKLWKKDTGFENIDIAQIAYNRALQDVQCEMDALEVQEEPVSEDFEKAAKQYSFYIPTQCEATETWKKETEQHFIDGAKWKKKQMMAKAINTKASLIMSVPSICISLPLGVNVGDKVKVIVIKED